MRADKVERFIEKRVRRLNGSVRLKSEDRAQPIRQVGRGDLHLRDQSIRPFEARVEQIDTVEREQDTQYLALHVTQ